MTQEMVVIGLPKISLIDDVTGDVHNKLKFTFFPAF